MSDTNTDYVRWRGEPPTRGTFNIFITCLTTLGICIWSALHLSIPLRMRSWKRNFGLRVIWVFLGLIGPELLILVALAQRHSAGRLRDIANQEFGFTGKKDAEKDSKDEDVESLSENTDSVALLEAPKRQHRWSRVHGFYAVMGGFAFNDSKNENRRIVLKTSDVEYILKNKLHAIPDISEETINDKNKADGLAKALLLAQTTWFCFNCITRYALRFPVALLEVTTLAHALCAVYVYILWWHKPLNIQEPTLIPEPDEELRQVIGDGRTGDGVDIEFKEDAGYAAMLSILVGISLLYGAPHLFAWNTKFPTHTEQLIWRISAVYVTSSGLLALPIGFAVSTIPENWYVWQTITGLTLFAYIAANFYLVGESLRQLFYLPPGAYDLPRWASYFPHFS